MLNPEQQTDNTLEMNFRLYADAERDGSLTPEDWERYDAISAEMRKRERRIITRDGEVVQTVDSDSAVLRYFHTHHSYSAHHGTTYEGYRVTNPRGQEIFF